eukprot:CAMPEP_0202903424 /NCGR_PEP_ID=MMETSP1392-20130828/24331_1 /ASSEMBLY_ACC=CAM_ASM_000868 /TAXON_ID=225041 /ORGANISM="Chlamydomonas chlamydogama, Strain SAG 11-48b" /LENGTH=309 /DNA_ID=CAMNT_0049590593 /DNA_START=212 /DNA_END=1138 /DNA_ORIENTATION=-
MPLPQASSLRDRTPEFLAIVERLQKQQGLAPSTSALGATGTIPAVNGGSSASLSRDPKAQIQQHSEFARKAADIGHGIHRTSMKLQKLAQLAKRTSMFDDPTAEVEELTGIIKQDIQSLNHSIAELQRISARMRDENKQSADHSHTVVDNLRSRLKDATMEFKDVLTVRTESLKHHKERRQLFSANADPEASVPLLRHRQGDAFGADLQGQQQSAPQGPSFLQSAAQQQQMQLAQPQDTYLSSRAEALRNVESTIVELGTIFNKLSEMVAQQGELAIRIDENMEETLSNVTNAQAQLLKYLNSISSNRW